ncbi:HNH endonuclease family protein [Caulifigura coniformis]
MGATRADGFGVLRLAGRLTYPHRVAFYLSGGKSRTSHVTHTCGNHACCNPKHLTTRPGSGKLIPVPGTK